MTIPLIRSRTTAVLANAGRKHTLRSGSDWELAALHQNPEGTADLALLERLVAGDENALAALYDRYGRLVYSLAIRITRQPPAAEEITQDVFLLLWRNARRYEAERGAIEPWLYTMARNRSLDYLRQKRERQRRQEDELDDAPPIVSLPAYAAEIDRERRAKLVRKTMEALPAREREAILLAFFEGLTHHEVAARLSEPLGTVKSWIRNGLLRLKKTLSGEAILQGSFGESQ